MKTTRRRLRAGVLVAVPLALGGLAAPAKADVTVCGYVTEDVTGNDVPVLPRCTTCSPPAIGSGPQPVGPVEYFVCVRGV